MSESKPGIDHSFKVEKDQKIDQTTHELVKKLHPTYSEYLQKLMVDLTNTFAAREELFSRLRSPERITSGGKTVKQLKAELNQASININSYAAQDLLQSKEFSISKEPEQIDLVRLKLKDLFPNTSEFPTTDEIYHKAQELGLELCPAEAGPAYCLALAHQMSGELKKEQPMNEHINVAMKQISDPDGRPSILILGIDERGVRLDIRRAKPTSSWNFDHEFVFRLPPSPALESKT